MARLIFRHISGSRRGSVEVYPTARINSLTIGRDPGSDVRFHVDQDAVVSRHHAAIEWKTSDSGLTRFTLVDLLSSNGTFLNGRSLSAGPGELRTGDRIQFGRGGPDVQIEIDELAEPASGDASSLRAAVGRTQEIPSVTLLSGRTSKQSKQPG